MDGLTPILFGHAAFQYLNAGCELGLFELLHKKSNLCREDIGQELQLAERATDTLLLGTTSLKLTTVEDRRYRNASVLDQLMEDDQWDIFTSVVAFEAHIVYEAQADFVESLRKNTNIGLRRVRGVGRDLYHRFVENPQLERVFYRYMRSWSELSNPFLLANADFASSRKVLDAGGGDGVNAIALAYAHPHLEVTVMEIPATGPIARKRIEDNGLAGRVTVHGGDMFRDEFPADVDTVLFSHQLVIWEPEQNIHLLSKAYEVLPEGGRVIIFSSMSSDEGDGPLMAALDSVYFATLPAEGGMIYAWHQYESWLRTAGFDQTKIRRVAGEGWTPHGIVIATK
ncbi:methyltransferase [Lentzea sp. NBRC 105346]|nr:methyltransferase [Lentzea sp. NBRC 105346]